MRILVTVFVLATLWAPALPCTADDTPDPVVAAQDKPVPARPISGGAGARPSRTKLLVPGILLTAAGGVSMVTGTALFLAAFHIEGGLNQSCAMDLICDPTEQQDMDRVDSYRMGGAVALLVGAGLLVPGIILIIVDRVRVHRWDVTAFAAPRFQPGFAGAVLGVTF